MSLKNARDLVLVVMLSWGRFQPRLVLSWLCSQGWPWISNPPDSLSQGLGLQVCATTPFMLHWRINPNFPHTRHPTLPTATPTAPIAFCNLVTERRWTHLRHREGTNKSAHFSSEHWGRGRWVSWVQGQPGQQGEFQDSQGSVERPCL